MSRILPGLITTERCISPIEAHILAGRLEAEGISAFVAHEHHVWANWFMSNALHRVKVQVVVEQAEEAFGVKPQFCNAGLGTSGPNSGLLPTSPGQRSGPMSPPERRRARGLRR